MGWKGWSGKDSKQIFQGEILCFLKLFLNSYKLNLAFVDFTPGHK